ncbi:hypothetical protein GCM10022252_75960 [Streptosporangium oxazolinicum]|uniref:Fibronectin type-III domain-containing protein n=1 Tax=Streptosporangium oxazolinicum TaxID=909287 RepID=A0ABP8BLM8_9ACTN
MIFVHSYAGVSGTSSGYEEHEWAAHTLGIRLFSRVSYGGETTFGVGTSDPTDRIFIHMFELTDCPHYYGSASARTTGAASMSVGDLPDGCVALVGLSQYVTDDDAALSWPSGFVSNGVLFRNWSDPGSSLVKQVYAATADRAVSGSLSFSQRLISLNSKEYAWAAGVFGPSPDETPPSVPSELRLTGMTPTSVTVAWDAASDNVGVVGYGVYLNGVSEGDQGGRTKTFTGLTPGLSYNVQVDAYDSKGNRSERAELTVTPINDTTPPDVPVVRVAALGAGTISVAWDTPADQSVVVGYGVYRNGAKVGADQVARLKTFTGLTTGAVYTIGVDAIDLLGNRSAKGTRTLRAQADTTPPTLPGGVHVVAATKTSVTVAWTASSDDNAGVAGYGLYLGAAKQAEIPSTVYTFTGLTPGILYSFGVDAVDGLGNRTTKVMVQAATLPDLSGQAPPYEYVMYDWSSHVPLDSLPLQNVSFEITLGGSGMLTADIPLYDEDYTVGRVSSATRPERTMILVYRGERLVWGGRLIDPQDYDSESGVLRITAEEVIGVFGRRFIAFTGPRMATLAHTEIAWLLEHAASPADLRWLTYSGVPGTVAIDREYRAEEFGRILDQLGEVAAGPGGFEWWVKPAWDNTNDRPRFELRRVNRDDPPDTGLTLEYPGNVRKYTRSTRRGLETQTWGKLPLPDGGVMLSKVTRTDLMGEGWPLLEDAHQFDGLTSQAALNAEAQRASAAAAGAKQVFECVLAITPDVRWWEWELGGHAQMLITDHLYPVMPDGGPGLDRAMKIVSLRVEPDSDEGELVTVTTGEHTVAVD